MRWGLCMLSPEIAIQGFHSAAGWIAFLLVTLGCIAVSRRLAFFAPMEPAQGTSGIRRAGSTRPPISVAICGAIGDQHSRVGVRAA